MTQVEVQRRWGITIKFPRDQGSPGCDQTTIKAGPMKGEVIFFKKRFVAVFFWAGAVTPEGIRIGSTEAQLKKVYGSRLHSEPDRYTRKAKNEYVRGGRYELRFDVSPKSRVTSIAFGDSAVHLVEGCL
jgi:hypothetical protein